MRPRCWSQCLSPDRRHLEGERPQVPRLEAQATGCSGFRPGVVHNLCCPWEMGAQRGAPPRLFSAQHSTVTSTRRARTRQHNSRSNLWDGPSGEPSKKKGPGSSSLCLGGLVTSTARPCRSHQSTPQVTSAPCLQGHMHTCAAPVWRGVPVGHLFSLTTHVTPPPRRTQVVTERSQCAPTAIADNCGDATRAGRGFGCPAVAIPIPNE